MSKFYFNESLSIDYSGIRLFGRYITLQKMQNFMIYRVEGSCREGLEDHVFLDLAVYHVIADSMEGRGYEPYRVIFNLLKDLVYSDVEIGNNHINSLRKKVKLSFDLHCYDDLSKRRCTVEKYDGKPVVKQFYELKDAVDFMKEERVDHD